MRPQSVKNNRDMKAEMENDYNNEELQDQFDDQPLPEK